MPQAQIPAPDLTERQRRFVELYVGNGGRNQQRAAILAGIAPSGAAAWASRALRNPGILAELDRVARTRVKAATIEATETLLTIMRDPTTPPAERRKAASEVLDRSGWIVSKVTETQLTVGMDGETREALVHEIRALAEARGFDPRLLFGGLGDWFNGENSKPRRRVIDAELLDDGAEVEAGDASATVADASMADASAEDGAATPTLEGLEDLMGAPAAPALQRRRVRGGLSLLVIPTAPPDDQPGR